MAKEQRILVYSDTSDSRIREFLRKKIKSDYRVDFVNNIPALITSINLNNYDLCIINIIPSARPESTDGVIRILMKYRIPVYLRHLSESDRNDRNSQQPVKTINFDFSADGKRRKQETSNYGRNYRSINSDKKILNQVGATLNHEINSPLMAISANVEMLRGRSDLDVDCARKLETIDLAVTQIKDVLEKILEMKNIRWIDTPAGKMLDLRNNNEEYTEKEEFTPSRS